jgi:hypothetical protein
MKSESKNSKPEGRGKAGSRRRPFRIPVFGLRSSDFAPVGLAAGAALLLAAAPGVRAQQTGQATDFTTTEYYEPPNQQQIKSILSGTNALYQPGRPLLIKQLEIQTFDLNGKTNMIVKAPECLYDEKNGTANSAGPLHLQNGDGQYRVEGEGFLWRQADSFLTISNKVHTVIEDRSKLNTKL